ncbi:MAG: hypothetical protein KC592_15440 [Nitrospira sp.]|nr:hypothetical protein [Nitrospira sp.]
MKALQCLPVIRSGSIGDSPNVVSFPREKLGGDGGGRHGVGFEHAMDFVYCVFYAHGTGGYIQISAEMSSGDDFESFRSLRVYTPDELIEITCLSCAIG